MIKIKHDSSITDEEAMERVLHVIKDGRVSETCNGKQYCFVTSWTSIVVYADRTKAGVDSFEVTRT